MPTDVIWCSQSNTHIAIALGKNFICNCSQNKTDFYKQINQNKGKKGAQLLEIKENS